MKGIVFNVLEHVVVAEHGEDTWDALLDAAGLEGAWTALGSYDDAELLAIVGAASAALGLPPAEVVRWFGRSALPVFAAKYPHFFTPHDSARGLVLALNAIVHPEVRKLYPGASVPEFALTPLEPRGLEMGYRSDRKLCAFAVGLVEGSAVHYGEQVAIEHPSCMLEGDEACRLTMTFSPLA